MATRSKGWVEKLEAHYKEDALTLIPRLLTYYNGVQGLSDETGVTVSTIVRWCKANGVKRAVVYRPPEAVES